jgi:hypothetical protein
VHFKSDVQVLGVPEVIHETSEEHLNDSSYLHTKRIEQLAYTEHNEEHAKLSLIEKFQHIDTQELEKLGVASKAEFTEEAIPEIHEFSML